MTALKAPFDVGSVWWRARTTPVRVEVQCPVCAGKLAVTLELGNGERVSMPCEACGKGFSRPRGTVDEHDQSPDAFAVRIVGVLSYRNEGGGEARWQVEVLAENLVGAQPISVYFDELHPTFERAMAASTEAAKKWADEQEANRAGLRKRDRLGNYAWNAYYHKKQIEDLERSLRWHREHLKSVTEDKKEKS